MRKNRRGLLVVLACLVAFAAGTVNYAVDGVQSASEEPTLAPEQIAAAIEWGTTGKPEAYLVPKGSKKIAAVYTPFLRVALAARAAKEQYKPFTASDVQPEWLEPVAWMRVWTHPQSADPSYSLAELSYVSRQPMQPVTVLAMLKGGKDLASAIRPVWLREQIETVQNIFGAQWQERGFWAAFPLTLLTPDYDILIVYDSKTWALGGKPEERVRGRCGMMRDKCVPVDRRDSSVPARK